MKVIKNSKELVMEKFETWDSPMGPFQEIDAIIADMSRFADYLGDEHAAEFVRSLLWMIDHAYPHLEVVYEFMDIYVQKYSGSIATAIIKQLTPQGPPLLIEMLGATKEEAAVDFLVKTINLNEATEALAVATIGAIGEIGGVNALKALQNIRDRYQNMLSQPAVLELETVIGNMERSV